MSQYGWHNCPANVKAQVNHLVDAFGSLLNANMAGVYLHGSLAMGCFNPQRSDIDLLVVTHEPTDLATKRDLIKVLLAYSLQPCPVELSFLRRSDLVPWQYPTPFDLHYGEGWRSKYTEELSSGTWQAWNDVQAYDTDLAAHITVTNARGITLLGASIAETFPAVPRQDFVASILDDVESAKFGLQGIAHNAVYVVLNACRTLAYLQTDAILSKAEGGVWALQHVPASCRGTVEAALQAYQHTATEGSFDDDQLQHFSITMQNEINRLK